MASDEKRYGPADYEPDESPGSLPHAQGVGASSTVGLPFVPVATPIPAELPSGLPPAGPIPPFPGPYPPWPPEDYPHPPWPVPNPRPWVVPWGEPSQGCYRISFSPRRPPGNYSKWYSEPFYLGTMRVDKAEYPSNGLVISGDLYRFMRYPFWPDVEAVPIAPLDIPIYERGRYYSYLKVTNLQRRVVSAPIRNIYQLTLTVEEYVYTPPPANSFNGTFPAPSGTRTVTIVLEPKPGPPGYPGDYLAGELYAGGVPQGTFTMGWVSGYFRKATLEIDTLAGAVAPTAVPARSGSGMEDFRTAFASAGWDLNVVYDQTDVPTPKDANDMPVDPNKCWSKADLHGLMSTVRNPATDLDREWRVHLMVVPAKLGSATTADPLCGRGLTYDTIGVPREGVATFSNDGYFNSAADSLFYGTAAGMRQRDVPRAYLRNACHEVGHAFNQKHQGGPFGEGEPDNSIMTSTDLLADFLGTPPPRGVFPDDIALTFNRRVRHHLIHLPDIVVRPGGMSQGPFTMIPEADRSYFSSRELELTLQSEATRIELGEPLRLGWTLVNNSDVAIPVPSDIRIEAQHVFITVTNPDGLAKPMPSFVIQTDMVHMQELTPGESLRADTAVFWSSMGFTFEIPGRHVVELQALWNHDRVPVGVRATMEVWVRYPQSAVDDEAADLLLDPEVGMYVALGGGASHLRGAVSRLERAMAIEPPPGALRGYHGLLPDSQNDESGDERDGAS